MTIIDRASLDGATKDEVRQRFGAWCETEVTEGNGQLAAPTQVLDRRGTKGAQIKEKRQKAKAAFKARLQAEVFDGRDAEVECRTGQTTTRRTTKTDSDEDDKDIYRLLMAAALDVGWCDLGWIVGGML
ncbi:hypothetical protein MCOR27_006558 [Pyricularia oryzae]|uniref:Uncharacterized protein n=1 Tax=Pyricularia oryzae TaxID=318829 RepID=A0A4V1C7K2_PYROR|nr:hypothetical protein MCOR01_002250 [Pyricularia oryzae]KAH9429168.1 hypothetical protein MCOR02_010576 [Pyricularia oryzae]KAI6259184.1 hypothetical protein MCOR19_004495 [Pyricularia oryzae]KAI6276296.1 hypothetical protein MCOR27_006558 [Pyricularia oryzae]KAI6286092.1 hypothetical protein MCOR26_001171 [Pyricularia oryzae]